MYGTGSTVQKICNLALHNQPAGETQNCLSVCLSYKQELTTKMFFSPVVRVPGEKEEV